jgi:hypothetical protein
MLNSKCSVFERSKKTKIRTSKILSDPISDYAFTIGSNAIIGAILIFIGLWVSAKSNLGAPVVARIFSKRPVNEIMNWKSFLSCITLAIAVAVILL